MKSFEMCVGKSRGTRRLSPFPAFGMHCAGAPTSQRLESIHLHDGCMKLDELKTLVEAGEGEGLELKATTGQRSEACKALCAFWHGRRKA